jgi:GT2 family glycosyltransferase
MRISAPGEGVLVASPVPTVTSRERSVHGTPTARERPAVSVIVPTLGRPQLLQNCLSALIRCRPERADLEVIIVDDGPSIATHAIVAGWAARYAGAGVSLRYEANTGPHGPAAARNIGWRAARGSLVAFTDDDTEPAPDWIDSGLRAFDGALDAAWGRIVMPIPPVPTDYELDANGLERAGFVTANCFCRRETLERLEGFDEDFRTAWREDTDFYFRLLDSGARVAHLPDAVVVHPVRAAPWGVSLRQQRKVLFDALLFKKHPRRYRESIRARPRFDYYAAVLALLGTVVGLAASAPRLAVGSAICWLAMTAWFSGKRLVPTSKAPAHVAEMLVTSMLIPPLAVFWRFYGALKYRTLFL